MKKKILVCGIMMSMFLSVCGCAGQRRAGEETTGEGTSSSVTEEKAQNDMENSPVGEDEKRNLEDFAPEENGGEKGIELVGIRAHVKEICEDTLLISSDSDDYPGAFTVIGAKELPGFSDLKGGTMIHILMQKLDEKDEQGLAVYRAESLSVVSEDEEEAKEDIFLTDAPTFVLQDVLSSKMDFVELRSGNYTWNVEENGVGTGGVACGAAPLDEASMDFTVRLKVPEYNGMDGAYYIFSTKAAPDTLFVSRWDAADIGNNEAEEERTIKYYDKPLSLELEAGKVYEFTAVWKEKEAGNNKFYGNASYVLVTE